MKGFTFWAASALDLNLSAETWIPLVAGMAAGVLSIVAFRIVAARQRRRPAPAAPANETPAPDPFVHGSASEQRRAWRRGGNPVPVLIKIPTQKDPGWRGWVFDRSVGGLGLVVENAFEPGAQLSVLPEKAPQSMPWIDIEVKSCRPGEDGFELGCKFVKTPPWSVLLLFG